MRKYNKKNIIIVIVILLFGLFKFNILAQNDSLFIINKKNLAKISRLLPFERDEYLQKRLNKKIVAKGYIEAIKEKAKFKKKYRIDIIDSSEAKKIDIRYYIYTDKKEYLDLLNKGDLFEFKGQFVIYTPLNSNRSSYVFDVILEDGAIVVD
jgi:hypothetical protein